MRPAGHPEVPNPVVPRTRKQPHNATSIRAMWIAIFLLVTGLGLLTFGADLLVRGSSSLALRLGISPFVVGLTVVGFGTSSPELAASLAAAIRGSGDIAVGNVVGSNIFNIAVILGLTALIVPIPIRFRAIRAELLWTVVAGAVPWLALLVAGQQISRWMGAVIFAGLGVFLVRAFIVGRRAPDAPEPRLEADLLELVPGAPRSAGTTGHADSQTTTRPRFAFTQTAWWAVVLSIVGLGLLVGGSQLLVGGAVSIARSLGISELVIGLTIVAAGTSMPELVTSIAAALRKSADLALGNILGSNVFNIFGILGLTAIVAPQRVTQQSIVLDTSVMFGISVLLAVMCFTGSKISRWEGAVLIVLFAIYTTVLIAWAPGWFA